MLTIVIANIYVILNNRRYSVGPYLTRMIFLGWLFTLQQFFTNYTYTANILQSISGLISNVIDIITMHLATVLMNFQNVSKYNKYSMDIKFATISIQVLSRASVPCTY